MSEMMLANAMETLKQNKLEEYFLIYSKETVKRIQKIGHIADLIEKFSSVHGSEIEENLKAINDERNFIIHNMLKEEMSERQIEKSFEAFLTATNGQINKVYQFFDKTLKERPRKTLATIEKTATQKTQ